MQFQQTHTIVSANRRSIILIREKGQWGEIHGQKSSDTIFCEVFKPLLLSKFWPEVTYIKLIYWAKLWWGFPRPSCPRRRFRDRRRLCTFLFSRFYFCYGLIASPVRIYNTVLFTAQPPRNLPPLKTTLKYKHRCWSCCVVVEGRGKSLNVNTRVFLRFKRFRHWISKVKLKVTKKLEIFMKWRKSSYFKAKQERARTQLFWLWLPTNKESSPVFLMSGIDLRNLQGVDKGFQTS